MSTDPRAARWYAVWNARDLDAIMDLYADDIEFASPFVAALGFATDGVITLKPMLRAYFEVALSRVTDLRFDPLAVCAGCHGHTLVYRNQSGVLVTEAHDYDDDGRIVRASVAYEITS